MLRHWTLAFGALFGRLVTLLAFMITSSNIEEELEIDPKTGMTNYIANESLSIATSSGYIRDQLRLAIKHGRDGSKEENKHVAMRHLGAALHTLEGSVCFRQYC